MPDPAARELDLGAPFTLLVGDCREKVCVSCAEYAPCAVNPTCGRCRRLKPDVAGILDATWQGCKEWRERRHVEPPGAAMPLFKKGADE